MVKYDQTLHKRNKYDRPQNSDCLELNINYDPHKVLDKVNNHKKPNAPNFDLMTSRPNQPDSLPCYLKVKFLFSFIILLLILNIIEYPFQTIC